MPQHSTRPTEPRTWDHPSNGEDPRQLALPFDGTISGNRWTETATRDPLPAAETALKSEVRQVHGPKPPRKAARHRWDGHRCQLCGLTREGRDGRFFGHRSFTTPDGEIMRVPGDCPGNPKDSRR